MEVVQTFPALIDLFYGSFLKIALLVAIEFAEMLCGASLDQSIKQLPAMHRIGVKAYSAYAKAADLKNGVAWYGLLGIGSALASVSLATSVLSPSRPLSYM
jgi:hypothetical protein